MSDDHAIVEREGYRVPLIGVPADAVLEHCDLCGDVFPLRTIELSGSGQWLCLRCRSVAGKTKP